MNSRERIRTIRHAGDSYRASGFWTQFYHNVMALFGMENYLVNMYKKPELVHAVTDRVCEFYYEANERFFAAAGELVDGFFFGYGQCPKPRWSDADRDIGGIICDHSAKWRLTGGIIQRWTGRFWTMQPG